MIGKLIVAISVATLALAFAMPAQAGKTQAKAKAPKSCYETCTHTPGIQPRQLNFCINRCEKVRSK